MVCHERPAKSFVLASSLAVVLSGCTGTQSTETANPHPQEPACIGVTLEQVEPDRFRVLPTLSGDFIDPDNVRSFLQITEAPTPPETGPGTVVTLPDASGKATPQEGVGYVLGLQAGSHKLAQLVMYDFQTTTPPTNESLSESIPTGTPEVTCSPTDLGRLVVKLYQTN